MSNTSYEDWGFGRTLGRQGTGGWDPRLRAQNQALDYLDPSRAVSTPPSRSMARYNTPSNISPAPWVSQIEERQLNAQLPRATTVNIAPNFGGRPPQEVNLSTFGRKAGQAIIAAVGAGITGRRAYKAFKSDDYMVKNPYKTGDKYVRRGTLREIRETQGQPWRDTENALNEGTLVGTRPSDSPSWMPPRVNRAYRDEVMTAANQPWRQTDVAYDEGEMVRTLPYVGSSQNLPVLWNPPPGNRFNLPDEARPENVSTTEGGPYVPLEGSDTIFRMPGVRPAGQIGPGSSNPLDYNENQLPQGEAPSIRTPGAIGEGGNVNPSSIPMGSASSAAADKAAEIEYGKSRSRTSNRGRRVARGRPGPGQMQLFNPDNPNE